LSLHDSSLLLYYFGYYYLQVSLYPLSFPTRRSSDLFGRIFFTVTFSTFRRLLFRRLFLRFLPGRCLFFQIRDRDALYVLLLAGLLAAGYNHLNGRAWQEIAIVRTLADDMALRHVFVVKLLCSFNIEVLGSQLV